MISQEFVDLGLHQGDVDHDEAKICFCYGLCGVKIFGNMTLVWLKYFRAKLCIDLMQWLF